MLRIECAERWRPIDGSPGYDVSDFGRVRSPNKVLRMRWSSGYRRVNLGASRRGCYVHRLVGRAFHGPPGPGLQVNHENSIRHDNRPANLEWVTGGQNVRHGAAKGHYSQTENRRRGEAHHASKLTFDEVCAIRAQYAAGDVSQKALGREFGVSQPSIGAIVHHRTRRLV